MFLPKVGESRTRGHKYKVRVERYIKFQRGIFFIQTVVSRWNELPEAVVEAGTILSFKKPLDSYMGKMGVVVMAQMRGTGTSLLVKTGRHGQVGLKDLFPCYKRL